MKTEYTHYMKRSFFRFLLFILIGSTFISACSGGFAATSWPGVTLDGDTIYVAHGGSVFAVGLKDGGLIWQYPEKPDASKGFYAVPAVIDGQVIVGDYTNLLHSLDVNTGTEKWVFNQAKGRWIGGALVVDEKILAPSADNTLYAINNQGKLLWKFTAKQALWAQPVVKDDIIYLTSMDHFLYALTIQGGKELWSTDVGGAVVYSPALNADGIVFVGTLANEVVALSTSNGKILWRINTKSGIWGTPTVDNGFVYVGDLSGTIYSINATDGSSRWTLDAGGPVTAAGVVTSDGIVFATENGNILMVSPDGKKVWTKTIAGKMYSSPVVAEDRLIFGVMGGEKLLIAVDYMGNDLWSFALPK